MKNILLMIILFLASFRSDAQYILQGRIEYERKVNVHRQNEDNEWFQRFKDQVAKFDTHYFELQFTRAKSLYKPGKEVENSKMNWSAPPGADNKVFTDFNTHAVTAWKQIYEQQFLIQDSQRHLKWRITGEIRTIAGYKCRKAVTRICDSVYVVAFYADDIAVSGGPEQFGGLPGMILELAVPRLFATWVATKVELVAIKEEELVPDSKGKKMNQEQLYKNLKESLKDWGKYGQQKIWWSTL